MAIFNSYIKLPEGTTATIKQANSSPFARSNKQDHYDTTWAAAPTTKLPAQWLVVIGAFSHDHRGFVEGAKVLTHLQTHLCHIEVLRVKKMLRATN